MSFAEKIEARGEVRGKAEGKTEVAINMLKEGADAAFIAKVTGLSLAEIEYLKERLNS